MRKKSLLNQLMQTNFLTLEQLAKRLQVSTRTVREDIKRLRQESPSFDILKSKNRGYYLVIHEQDEWQRYLEALAQEKYISKNDRVESILIYMLMMDRFITNKELADTFDVSLTQIKKDTAVMGELIEGNELQLERKSHYGLKIIGNLYQKFQLMDRYYQERHSFLIKIMQENLTPLKEKDIQLAMREICKAYQMRDEGDSSLMIQRWLELLVVYHQLNDQVYLGVEIPEMRPLKVILMQYPTTRGCVCHSQLLYQLLLEYQSHCLTSQTHLRGFLETLFCEVDERFKTQFVSDIDFMRMVHVHIAVMLESRQLGNSQNSFLIESMEREFPAIMNAAIFVVKRLEEHYHLNVKQEEIGYLTSHMAVSYVRQHEQRQRQYYRIALVCSSGGGLAQLMALRFARIFPQSLIQAFALTQERELVSYRPDLVFTIKPLDFEIGCPVVQIREVLGELDYFNIQNNLDVLTTSGSLSNSNQDFIDMIRPDLFFKGHFDTYEHLLATIAKKVEASIPCPNYQASVLERESYVSTVYDNGIAIPHPMEMNSPENVISVTVLPKAIPYEDKQVRVVFMLALRPGQVELHQYLSKKLYGLMQHRTLIKDISESTTVQELINLLALYL